MLQSERKKILAQLKILVHKKGNLSYSHYSKIEELMSARIGLNFEILEDDIYFQHLNAKKYFFLKKHPHCKDFFNNKAKTFGTAIEGDNLPILFLLQNTHQTKVDLIYIDPPYNNGNSGFTYNNDYFIKRKSLNSEKKEGGGGVFT